MWYNRGMIGGETKGLSMPTSKHAPRAANPIDVHVGTRIRLRRKTMKMSQEQLGDQLGITFQQVQKYERGTNRVGASRLWKISQVLQVPIQYFYDGLKDGISDDISDNTQSPIIYDFINSSDGIALATAVTQINNRAVRRQILELARSLAEQENVEDL